jgi:hypothetical protein
MLDKRQTLFARIGGEQTTVYLSQIKFCLGLTLFADYIMTNIQNICLTKIVSYVP